MKIGIVTQPLGENYGGILQNYALQQTLKRLGFESITIDNYSQYSETRYLTSSVLSLLLKLLGIKRPFPSKPFKGRSIPKITGKFIAKHIKISRPKDYLSEKTLKKYGIDTLIVGSDQVWRPAYNKSLYKMYLDFAPSNCKKIAYAASFGTNEWEYDSIQTEKCKQLLKQFCAVSVREQNGVELAKKYLGCNKAKFALDPTLLLSKTDYLSLCSAVHAHCSKYLCAYILDKSEEKKAIINSIAKAKGLEVCYFSAHSETTISVEEWISNFRDASFVVTDSFHGTVFSIIFERDFIVLPNENRGKDRFTSLLSVLDLSNRIWSETENLENAIQWDKVKDKLSALRQESICFLKDALPARKNKERK